MEAITLWAKQLIYIVLFAAFLELLLPTNNMRRFIRIVMGMYIMLAIISPAVNIIQQHEMPESFITLSAESAIAKNEIRESISNIKNEKDRLTLNAYKSDLVRQIRALIVGIDGISDAQVSVDINTTDNRQLGAIKSILLYITPGLKVNTKMVEQVKLGSNNQVKGELDSELKKRIINMISEIYQIKAGQIEVIRS